MSLTDQQLQDRRAYLGGTDAAAIAGVNPPKWAQPIDVYLEKRGLAPDRASSTMMSMGALLEPVVAGLFTQATGVRLRKWNRPIRSGTYPWAGGHLDRWADGGSIFEAKWSMRKDGWGPSHEMDALYTDDAPPQVPLHYAVQVQHYLAVTGRPRAYLAVLLGWGDFRWYRIARNPETIRWLMALEATFWRDHVLAGVPPEPDGSESYGKHLRRLYASDDTTEAVATPEQQLLADKLHLARQARERAQGLEAEHEQALQLSMGATAKLVGPDFTITWEQNKPTRKVAWEELVTEMLRLRFVAPELWPVTKKGQAELLRSVASQMGYLSEEPGARPFKPHFDSDDEETTSAT